MSPELDQHIREKYPLIFQNSCEMSIGDGWFDIVDNACGGIQTHIDYTEQLIVMAIHWNNQVNDPDFDWDAHKGSFTKREERKVPEPVEQVVATQIKEKFGNFRFYYQGGDDYIRGIVSMAEAMSALTCEECGHPGKKRNRKHWFLTLCDKHAEEQGFIQDEFTSTT